MANAIVGNFAAFWATMLLLTIYIITVVLSIFLKSKFIIRISELAIGLMFAFVLLVFGGGFGRVIGIVVLLLGIAGVADYFHIFKEKLSIPLLNRIDPNVCNYTCFIIIILILLLFVPETAVGVIIGIIVLVIVLVLLAIFGGEVVAGAAGGAGAAAGRTAATRLAPEALPVSEAEAQQAIKAIGGGSKGVPTAGAGEGVASQVDEAKQSLFKQAQEKVELETKKLDTELEGLNKQLDAAEKIGDKKESENLKKEIRDVLRQYQKIKSPELPRAGKEGRFNMSSLSKVPFAKACLILGIFGLIFLLAVFLIPSNSSAGQSLQGVKGAVNAITGSLFPMIVNSINDFIASVIGQFTVCEVGNTGVGCQLLKYRSCEPFCVSQTGEAQWKGFEITQLAVVPQAIFDYQKFSILAEFTNNGEGDAKFSGVSTPTFGYYVSGDNPLCEWNIYGALTWDFGCQKIFPIKQEQPDIPQISSGRCALPGGKLAEECTLSSKESTQVRWFGFEVEPNVVPKGQTLKPDITISIPYTFIVPNDLVGTITVQSLAEQVTSATGLKKEGQIVQKINKAYSPPGPLMMAMGTAEKQVVSGIPSLFLIQFANKGRGVVDNGNGLGISKNNIRVYIPPNFTTYDQSLCDFDLSKPVKTVSQLDKTKIVAYGKTEYELWNPGPGFENHKVYEITRNIPALGKTRNAAETPTLYCVLSTPEVTNINTYDFKARVLEYGYIESKRTSISITGTSLGGLGEAPKPLGGEYTISKKIKSCDSSDDPIFHNCNSQQTLDLGKEYDVTKITAKAKLGGSAGVFLGQCSGASIVFAGFPTGGSLDIFNSGRVDLGKSKELLPQSWGTITKSFKQSGEIRYIVATVDSFSPACGYIDSLSATITYYKTYDLKVDYFGKGAVQINPIITCGKLPYIPPLCTFPSREGTEVTLTAIPDDDSTFTGWSGSCSGTETTCTLTMDADKKVTAHFKKA